MFFPSIFGRIKLFFSVPLGELSNYVFSMSLGEVCSYNFSVSLAELTTYIFSVSLGEVCDYFILCLWKKVCGSDVSLGRSIRSCFGLWKKYVVVFHVLGRNNACVLIYSTVVCHCLHIHHAVCDNGYPSQIKFNIFITFSHVYISMIIGILTSLLCR